MDWVDESVVIGNFIEANNVSLLRKEDIDLVIDVRTAFNANALFESYFADRYSIARKLRR